MNNSNRSQKVISSYSNNKNNIYVSPLNNSYGQYCYCKLIGITTNEGFIDGGGSTRIHKATIPK